MMDYKNESELGHILTIEDPIEFVHESKKCLINQREVHRDTFGFSEALRSALREDPDVILVGEMRDMETISRRPVTWSLVLCIRVLLQKPLTVLLMYFRQVKSPWFVQCCPNRCVR